jgi:hypothetical protein
MLEVLGVLAVFFAILAGCVCAEVEYVVAVLSQAASMMTRKKATRVLATGGVSDCLEYPFFILDPPELDLFGFR